MSEFPAPPTPFRVLYREFLLGIVDLEMLSARADVERLLGQFAAVLAAISLMFCNGALRVFRSSAPQAQKLTTAWVDEHFLIATTMAVVGLFAVLAWDAVLPSPRDVFVLTPLPVRRRTIFLAKLASMGAALGLTAVALNVFTGFSYPLALGRGGGILGVPRAFLAYWATMLGAGAFVFGCVLALQGAAAQVLPRQLFLRVSGGLQLATFCVILCAYFLRPDFVTPSAIEANPTFVRSFPSYWFLGLFNQLNGSGHVVTEPLAWRAWAALAAVAAAVAVAFLPAYFRTMRRVVGEPDLRPGAGWVLPSPRVGDPLLRALAQFCARTFLRSRQHRLLLACYLGVGAAIALTFGRSVLYGEEGLAGYAWREVNRPMLIATVVLMCFAVVGMRVAFTLPASLRANWIFRTAVDRPDGDYLVANRRVLIGLAVIPATVFSAGVLASFWPLWPVSGHVALLTVLGLILVDLSLLRFRKIPFACSYLPGKAQMHVTAAALIFILIGLTDVGVRLEMEALGDPRRYAWTLGVLAGVAALLRRRVSTEMEIDSSLVFEQEPPADLMALDIRSD